MSEVETLFLCHNSSRPRPGHGAQVFSNNMAVMALPDLIEVPDILLQVVFGERDPRAV